MIISKRKNKTHMILIEELLREGLKDSANKIQGPTKVKADSHEFRCAAKNPHIGVMTINYDAINDVFPMNFLNKAFKTKEKLFIGLKFKTNGRTINPGYRFDVIPYNQKSLIRENFKEYVKYDDIATSNLKLDKNFMVKSISEVYVEHFTQNDEFQNQVILLQEYYKHLKISPGKEKTDPHMQLVMNFKKADVGYIIEGVEHFMNAAELHINNRDLVEKKILSKISRGTIKKTKSAKIRNTKKKKSKLHRNNG